MTPPSDIERIHKDRLEERGASHARLLQVDRRIADARLALFVVLLAIGWGVWGSRSLGAIWLLIPITGFAALVVAHERTRLATRKASRAIEFYARGLRNLDGTWPGTGNTGVRFEDDKHPFAADLDLFGKGSLFERICRARTGSGEETLAAWLKSPADSATIRARQAAVDELRPRLELREDLEILSADVRSGIDPQALIDWGSAPRQFGSRGIAIAAAVLASLAVLSLVGWAFTGIGVLPLGIMIIAEVVFVWKHKERLRAVILPLDRRAADLAILSRLLARIEAEPAGSELLVHLKERLSAEGELASGRIARLARLLNALEARQNQIFAPFAALLLWSTFFSLAIEAWRLRTGPSIARWLAAIGEYEALLSIASYAYEQASDPFPEIEENGVVFEGDGVSHPLLKPSAAIANDLRLGGETRAVLISGSNMSGKSTLLRTIGANTVLALAGAPVRARRLRVSVVSIGATLRIQDSLQQGQSRFFAELTRIRLIVDLSRSTRPLLFLLDEIFHGTNSHDRVIGAGGLVRGLLKENAIGLVTTHDLALAAFADDLSPQVINVHFEDQFHDGVMTFDYRLKPGVVTHSNALALMRAVGLEV